jgi:membrane protein
MAVRSKIATAGRTVRNDAPFGLFFVLSSIARFIVTCARIVNQFLGNNCPQMAASISFYALFSLFPLALAVISVLGYIAGSESVKSQLAGQIGQLVPISTDLVTETIQGVVDAKHITGIAAIIGLLWAANAVFGAIRKGVNTAWGIREPRPFFHERFIDFSLTVGAGILFLVSISSTAALSFFREVSRTVDPQLGLSSDAAWNLAAGIIPFILSFFTFSFLYWLLPNTYVRFRYVIPGAIAGAIAFEAVKNIFVFYVRNYADYNILYGPVGAVLALMTWLYMSALIFLFWAAVTSHYAAFMEERSARRRWRRVLDDTKTHTYAAPTSTREN